MVDGGLITAIHKALVGGGDVLFAGVSHRFAYCELRELISEQWGANLI